jgi:hypothetical protein
VHPKRSRRSPRATASRLWSRRDSQKRCSEGVASGPPPPSFDMAWIESQSPYFQCRHSSAFTADAARVLALLERTRERLLEGGWGQLQELPQETTVVLHDSATSLALANPLMGLIWALTAPTARRYVTGWTGHRELHVLSPEALRARASSVTGSHEMLALTPASLYVRRVLLESDSALRLSGAPRRLAGELHWAWMLEGIARWFSGESGHARNAIGKRMRDGRRPQFPPSMRDAPLLAPPLIDLLATLHGDAAVVELAAQLHPGGAQAALARAFSGRSLTAVESDWRAQLGRLAEGR